MAKLIAKRKYGELLDSLNIEKEFPSEYAYHYTSVDALFNIIENNSFLLCNLYDSNDPFEGKLSFKEFTNKLNKLSSDNCKNYVENSKIVLKSEDVKLFIKNVCNLCKNDNYNAGTIYGMSFSEHPDKLSQWERYTKLRGVCLKINLGLLKKLQNKNREVGNIKGRLKFTKIYYEEKFDLDFVVERYIENLISSSIIISKTIPDILSNQKYFELLIKLSFMATYTNYLYSHKSLTWSDETEKRIYVNEEGYKDVIKIDIYDNRIDKEFKVIHNKIKSYYKLDLENLIKEGLIKEIIIGPYCNQNIDELKSYLKHKGYKKIKITKSKVKCNL